MNYSNTFKENVKRWQSESEEPQENNSPSLPQSAINEEVLRCPTKDEPQVSTQAATIINTEDMQDDITPSDSVSNVRSKNSDTGRRSAISTASSARLKEADLAALMTRQKLLKDKHELEEQEERLKKKKEQLKMDEDIVAHVAKLNVLRCHSIISGKSSITRHSDGLNSYLEKGKSLTKTLKATKHDCLDPGTRP